MVILTVLWQTTSTVSFLLEGKQSNKSVSNEIQIIATVISRPVPLHSGAF